MARILATPVTGIIYALRHKNCYTRFSYDIVVFVIFLSVSP